MLSTRQIAFLLCTLSVLTSVLAVPDSAGEAPLPAPGLSYGGIPYGSMSGNVAEFFRQQATSGVRSGHYNTLSGDPLSVPEPNYAPIEQFL